MSRKVSIYIPCFNATSTIARTVEALRASSYPLWELLTVDDGGDPEAWKLADSLGVRVIREHGGENRGLAASCNTAMRNCTGEFLAKIDSDVEVASFWLDRVMPHFRDEAVAGVGGQLVEGSSSTLVDRWRATFMRQHHGTALVSQADLFGADCIFRVSALQQIGGWNERYRTNFEDMDLSQRLKAAGFLTIYEPQAVARHLRSEPLYAVLDNFHRWYRPPLEDKGAYASMETAAGAIKTWMGIAQQQIGGAQQMGAYILTYPSFLLFFWMCIRDLQHLVRVGVAPEELTEATLHAVGVAIHDMSERLPQAVAKRLVTSPIEPWRNKVEGWEPDPTYLAAFRAAIADLEVGEFSAWCLEASVAAMEDN